MNIDVNNITQSYINETLKRFQDNQELPQNEIISNIYKRLVLIDYIEKNYSSFEIILLDKSFLRSLQAYLLFSSSDSLGNGKSFYSFPSHITRKSISQKCNDIMGQVVTADLLFNTIHELYDDYEKDQSIKQSFFNFWNSIREYLKLKIVLCYYPHGNIDQWKIKYKEIIEVFYKVYRNPFTHSAMNNFPPIHFSKSISKYANNEITGLAYKDANDKILRIEIPLFYSEAEDIIKNAKCFYFVTANDHYTELNFTNPDDIIEWNINTCSYKNEIGDLKYVHNGIIKLLTIAIIEGCDKKNA